MESRVDTELLRLARKFDLNALTTIYDRYSQALYYYALRLLGDPALAEDCVSETFSRLLKAFRAGMGPDNFLKAYLYRSAHNWITDHYRREPVPCLELTEELAETGLDDPLDVTERRISTQRIRDAMRLLTPDQRQVISLRYIEGWEIEEVAQAVNKPVGAVKSLQHRGISALQKMLVREQIRFGMSYEYERTAS